MKSYASIEEIEGKFAICELEMIPCEESKILDFSEKDTCMTDIPIYMIVPIVPDFKEGDIIVVNHERGEVSSVCYKDDFEKHRRIKIIAEALKKISNN